MKKYVIIALVVIIGAIGFKMISARGKSAQTEKDEAWSVLEQYLNFAKDKNIEGVKSLSYQISDDCKDIAKKARCEEKITSVYLIGTALHKDDFKNIWSDKKQIILTTDFFRADDEDYAGLARSAVFFVKDGGKIKVLSFTPGRGAFTPKASSTEAEIITILNAKSKDEDQDGLQDAAETCTDLESSNCVKTDPTKRDTDGDGYWDGIEALFYPTRD
jgi:hypothetical protein